MPGIDETRPFLALRIAVLTISDSRTFSDDRSGDTLAGRLEAAGHRLSARAIVKDDIAAIRDRIKDWIGDDGIDAILTTGGTGITGRDVTPEAVEPMFDKPIPGFGELFRHLSFGSIGASAIQSRATAGVAGGTLIFCLPGSPGACRDAWDLILSSQLDSRYLPCNFAGLLHRIREDAGRIP